MDDTLSFLKEYNFNPFMKGLPDIWMRNFHRKHVPYFHGCNLILDLGAGSGLFLEELHASGLHGSRSREATFRSVQEGRAERIELL